MSVVYHGFTILDSCVRNGAIKWNAAHNAQYIEGKKNGMTYFIKRANFGPRRPLPTDTDEIRKIKLSQCEPLVTRHSDIAKRMGSFRVGSSHIVKFEEVDGEYYFWDDYNMFVTVTRFIEDSIKGEEDVLVDYDKERILPFVKCVIDEICKIHEVGVIHSDIKPANFRLQISPSSGEYIPYLVDFDEAFSMNNVPQGKVGGTSGYLPPESMLYNGTGEDDPGHDPSIITSAIDIFALALTWHKWFTGGLPKVADPYTTVGEAVFSNGEFSIDEKFGFEIGPKYHETFDSLLRWMLFKDPVRRATAKQVKEALADNMRIPSYIDKRVEANIFDGLSVAHATIATLKSRETLEGDMHVLSFERRNSGGSAQYVVTIVSGGVPVEKTLNIAQLCIEGYATLKSDALCEQWEEHRLKFADTDKFLKHGIVRVERHFLNGKHDYTVTNIANIKMCLSATWLVEHGLAERVVDNSRSGDVCDPWPGDGTFVTELLSGRGILRITRSVEEHRYKIEYEEVLESGAHRMVETTVNNLKLMGLLK